MNAYEYLLLVGCAKNKMDVATRAFAGVISSGYGATRLIPPLEYGMGKDEFKALMDEYFPGALGKVVNLATGRKRGAVPEDFRSDEYEGILRLLLDHLSRKDKEGERMAHAVAMACLGCDTLWQSMGLPNRKALTELIKDYFGPLHKKKKGDAKWKKFLYRQLCEREGISPCKSPTCEDCSEYDGCFGEE
ncbi:MAG: nitrogen fixation protein NifQ [Nitrospirae bacterium]|nr:nitrogen fixation protein NifQ [Nitrospirota bacterium]